MPRAGPGTASPTRRGSTCYDMLRFPLPAEVWRAMISAQVNMNSEFTSNPRLALVERDSRHKYSPHKELRRYDPRSKFPQKSPFRPHFGAFYPHSAHKSALRAKEPPTLWHPGNLVGPQRPPGHCSAAPRPTTPGPAGSGRAQTFPRWLLPSTDRRIVKNRMGRDLDERPVYIQRADKELKAPPALRGSAMVARPTRPQIFAVN